MSGGSSSGPPAALAIQPLRGPLGIAPSQDDPSWAITIIARLALSPSTPARQTACPLRASGVDRSARPSKRACHAHQCRSVGLPLPVNQPVDYAKHDTPIALACALGGSTKLSAGGFVLVSVEGPRADGDHHAGSRRCERPADARGYHGSGDQCPLSNRLELAGRRCTGADPHHEEDHQDYRADWYQTARPQSQREAAGARYRPRRTLEGEAELRETQECLRAAAQFDQPRGRTSQAVLGGDRLWREAGRRSNGATETAGIAPPDRADGAAGQAGHEANQGSDLSRRYSLRRQASERVRALDGGHPQRQGGQAQRIR